MLSFWTKKSGSSVLLHNPAASLPDRIADILLGSFSKVLPGRLSMVLPGSITAGLHDSTDDPDFFVQKASIDLQYYGSTVCSITSVLRQDADVEEISMQKEKVMIFSKSPKIKDFSYRH